VTWFLRCTLWASGLAAPCWLLSSGYQDVVASAAEAVLAAFGEVVRIREIEIMSPHDLGMFVAMCLSSRNAPWRERRRAMLVGAAALFVIEVLTVVLSIVLAFGDPAGGFGRVQTAAGVSAVLATIPWVGAVLVWLPLLGHHELPPMVSVAAPAK
jgi:hypothetical protein